MQETVFEPIPSESLRAYAVWEPILRTDEARAARKATAILPDSRVRHFWTVGQEVGEIFQSPLSLKGTPAWDVYLVYPPGVEWNGKSPPRPSYFMHQLHQLPASRRLDADTLAAHLQELLVKH